MRLLKVNSSLIRDRIKDCGYDVEKFINTVYNLSKLTVFNFEFNNSETNLVRRLEK